MKINLVDNRFDFQDYLKQCNPKYVSNAANLSITAIWHLTILDPDRPVDEDCVIAETYRRGSGHIICFKYINRPGGVFLDERKLLDGTAEIHQVRKPLSAYADVLAF